MRSPLADRSNSQYGTPRTGLTPAKAKGLTPAKSPIAKRKGPSKAAIPGKRCAASAKPVKSSGGTGRAAPPALAELLALLEAATRQLGRKQVMK
jgi:hypothetical protein